MGHKDGKDNSNVIVPQEWQDYKMPSAEESDEIMSCVLEHYIKHHKVVTKKLNHARDATKISIKEAEQVKGSADAIRNFKRYDELWDQVILMFRDAGVSDEELERIEILLTTIPKMIKEHYEILVEQDKVLQELVEELKDERYERMKSLVKEIHSKPNMMSGLGPEEYKPEKSGADISYVFEKIPVTSMPKKDKGKK